jgi:4-hydroxythreonine-4-phosphate dehydrogenase
VHHKPIIGITMGDPVGVGPEIIIKALSDGELQHLCCPVVFGDGSQIKRLAGQAGAPLPVREISTLAEADEDWAGIQVVSLSDLDPAALSGGYPTIETGRAMITYIEKVVDWALTGDLAGIVTCPINKDAMKKAGSRFAGHTELLAVRTAADQFAMMLAGDRLRVVLVTIHIPLAAVPTALTTAGVLDTIIIANQSLRERFGIVRPRIGVAGLNPHAGEGGLFGNEEDVVIAPAVYSARQRGIAVDGPLPPDTIFFQAVNDAYDAVVCMYHDQGLIPFKLLHFSDGVNTTLGLPIIRTSVDHGTAYDIAGTGTADPGSLSAAVRSALDQSRCQDNYRRNREP